MENKAKYDAVDRFLDELNKNGSSEVLCPTCKTRLSLSGNESAYTVKCQTPNCLIEEFRGI